MAAMTTAIIAAAVIGAGGSMLAASSKSKAAKKSQDMQMNQYLQTREDMAPWRNVGTNALNKLANLYGVEQSPVGADEEETVFERADEEKQRKRREVQDAFLGSLGGRRKTEEPAGYLSEPEGGLQIGWRKGGQATAAAPEAQIAPSAIGAEPQVSPTGAPPPPAQAGYSQEGIQGFLTSPGYQFRLGEGQRALEKSASARGLLRSGGTMKAAQEHAQGVASQEFNTYSNRLASLAGIGQAATQQTAAFGQQAIGQAAQAGEAAAAARASGYAGVGQAVGTGLGYLSRQQPQQTQGSNFDADKMRNVISRYT